MAKIKDYEIRSGEISRDSESRTVCGYAVRFDSDSNFIGYTERIAPGAITEETVKRSDVLALLNHDEQKVLARSRHGEGSMKLEVRSDGLYYEFEAPHTSAGDELLEQLKRGDISQSSFAFTVSKEDGAERWYRDAEGNPRREIRKIERLYDCSPVYYPAYEMTSCAKRSLDELTAEAEKIKDELENEVLAVHEEVQALEEQVESVQETVEDTATEVEEVVAEQEAAQENDEEVP